MFWIFHKTASVFLQINIQKKDTGKTITVETGQPESVRMPFVFKSVPKISTTMDSTNNDILVYSLEQYRNIRKD